MLLFTQYLDKVGIPWRARAQRIGLPGHIPAADSFLPSQLAMQFLGEIVMHENFPEMSAQASLGNSARISACYPRSKLETTFLEAPSLYAGLERLCSISSEQWSSFRFWLKETEGCVWLCSGLSYAGHPRGLEQQVQSRVIRVVGLIEQYLGFYWRPETLLLETRSLPSGMFADVLDCPRIIPGSRFSALPIPTPLLTRGGPRSRPETESQLEAGSDKTTISWNLVDCLRSILPEYVQENQISVGSVAEIAGVSSRTLQRALREKGVTFRELVEDARFEVARSKLADDSMTIEDISRLLGYSESTHFTRAFRRTAGRTPSAYRSDLANRSPSSPS
jgi:AraC-like DNA-binding protein